MTNSNCLPGLYLSIYLVPPGPLPPLSPPPPLLHPLNLVIFHIHGPPRLFTSSETHHAATYLCHLHGGCLTLARSIRRRIYALALLMHAGCVSSLKIDVFTDMTHQAQDLPRRIEDLSENTEEDAKDIDEPEDQLQEQVQENEALTRHPTWMPQHRAHQWLYILKMARVST
ncbi:hypothetical protein GGR50DRAFT_145365 [Xylaria sp. CBS 124048]|nr:hypothetical protein GGR50DRAFT_145365 [Xylaria sp. CBS 124048]